MGNRGEYGGPCFLSDCRTEQPATWLNHFTKQHYCPECADRLNRNKANQKDAQKLFGHELCTEVRAVKPTLPKLRKDSKIWTPSEYALLRRYYAVPERSITSLARMFRVSESTISAVAKRLGLKRPKYIRPARVWTNEEDSRIAREVDLYSDSQLANRLHVSLKDLRERMKLLGVKRTEGISPALKPGPKPGKIDKPRKSQTLPKRITAEGAKGTSLQPLGYRKLKKLGTEYRIVTTADGRQVIKLGRNTEIKVREGRNAEEVVKRFLERDNVGKKQSEGYI